MPKLWKFRNREEEQAPQIQEYAFASAEDLELSPDAPEPEQAPIPEVPEPEPEPITPERDPIGYAQVQADKILEQARQEAEEILAQAQEKARKQAEAAEAEAREAGYAAGFQQGRQEGNAQTLEETEKLRQDLEKEYGERIDTFSKSAERALTHQMNEHVADMRDLAMAVAEKVVCISLRSSSDVIAKMIQMAVDKRKRREWVHIYVSQCDARQMTSLPPALASALAELSDHVRIIPMADDESGTCIVEFPDEIVDASASTQLQNIKDVLSAQTGR